jgi:hypothetical protein
LVKFHQNFLISCQILGVVEITEMLPEIEILHVAHPTVKF